MRAIRIFLIIATLLSVIAVVAAPRLNHLLRARRLANMEPMLRKAFPGDTRQILENSPSFTLYSLNPGRFDHFMKTEVFHDHAVRGKATITRADWRERVLDALYDGIAKGKEEAKCFSPEHGIRAIQGSKTVDLVICFHCYSVEIYENGKCVESDPVAFDSYAAFNRVFAEAGLPVVR